MTFLVRVVHAVVQPFETRLNVLAFVGAELSITRAIVVLTLLDAAELGHEHTRLAARIGAVPHAVLDHCNVVLIEFVEVIVFAEGPSDELFLKRVLAPSLRANGIFLKPQTLRTSREGAGGAINFDRLKINVRNTLRQGPHTYLTTFFDLYALDGDMPGVSDALKLNHPSDKARHVEAELHRELVTYTGCRADRLLPYVQPYELEGLFFSDPDALSAVVPGWQLAVTGLRAVRAGFPTPEHINESSSPNPLRASLPC